MTTITKKAEMTLQKNITPDMQKTLDMIKEMKQQGLIKGPYYGLSHNF